MKGLKLPRCPYCDAKVDYSRLGYLVRKTEYECDFCKKTSAVKVKHSVFLLVRATGLLIALVMLIGFFSDKYSSLEISLIALFVAILCMLLPYFTELIKKDNNDTYEEKRRKRKIIFKIL